MNFNIIPITQAHIEEFWSGVDSVARDGLLPEKRQQEKLFAFQN